MIVYSKEKKELIMPLGGSLKGIGGGISPEEAQQIVDNSISAYDSETVQPQFNEVDSRLDDLEARGTGSTVAVTQTLTAGTQIAQISVDGSATTIYAPEAQAGKIQYFLSEMSQGERLLLYNKLVAEAGNSGPVGQSSTGDTINDKYEFYYRYRANSVCYRLQWCGFYYGRGMFSNVVGVNNDAQNNVTILKIGLNGQGEIEWEYIRDFSFPEKGTATVGYFDSFSQYPVYDVATSALTDQDGNALADGNYFGGSFFWFILKPIDGDWGMGINTLPFKVIDENGVEKMYHYPVISTKVLDSSVTIDNVEYMYEMTADYGDFVFSAYVNENPQYANAAYTPKAAAATPKQYILNTMTQAELKALYDEIAPYGLRGGYYGVSSAFPASEYAFYAYLGEGNGWTPFPDINYGTVPLSLAMIHPDDYGGALFFTGIVPDRRGLNRILGVVKINVVADGGIDKIAFPFYGTPGVVPFGFGWGEYAPLKYDAVNDQFLQGPNETVIDPNAATYGIAGSDDINQILNDGRMAYFDDRNAYAMPKYEIIIRIGGYEQKYQNPTIIREDGLGSQTVDGQSFSNKYTFIYTKEFGDRFGISMWLGDGNSQYATGFQYFDIQ